MNKSWSIDTNSWFSVSQIFSVKVWNPTTAYHADEKFLLKRTYGMLFTKFYESALQCHSINPQVYEAKKHLIDNQVTYYIE